LAGTGGFSCLIRPENEPALHAAFYGCDAPSWRSDDERPEFLLVIGDKTDCRSLGIACMQRIMPEGTVPARRFTDVVRGTSTPFRQIANLE
jgi:hypothetical protein